MNYDKGYYPIAMATSLTFERLTKMGQAETMQQLSQEENAALAESTHFLINLRTIYRSVHSAYNEMGDPTVDELAKAVADEVDTILLLFATQFGLKQTPVIYHMTYDNLPYLLPYARMRKLSTELQHKRKNLEDAVYRALPKHTLDLIHKFDSELSGTWGKCLMLTHMPVDLLSRAHCAELWLVETNTGRIKSREEWSQKLVSKREHAAFLPFNKMTLSVFGDGNKLLTGFAPSSKKVTLEMAVKHNWNPIVGESRIRDTLDRERDVPFCALLIKMLRS